MKAYFYLTRLHRPLPILLILWPTLWALLSASHPQLPQAKLLFIFTFGVLLTRTAGCIFNDIADRKFDFQVKRTNTRPITTGKISVKSAAITGGFLFLIAFILVLFLNIFTILLSFVALLLALTYPLFKRFFSMPQLALGLAFNFGVIMAYAAVQNTIPLNAWILYVACVCWTIAYDTMYALADMPYDKKLGLKSSAITFGKHLTLIISLLQTSMLVLLILFGLLNHYNGIFYTGVLLCTVLFYLQYRKWREKDIKHCIEAFSANHWVGLVIFIVILLQ
ncbi:4-hydroxybenzoate octaprenyltransferase [Facilibium subflavum]|uniref:4-hydroxybenzoate octaprenyltransferase n=1 Tax=Facilibium subflavum TaxID=2219058 RepID=UPI000E657ED9|nr:4-hydroxybenzoate octaprenyltransferase [Facilibium subflavum]